MDLQAQKATRARRATKVDGQFDPHLVLALAWAQRVLDGKVPAAAITKKCVRRFLHMIELGKDPKNPFEFSIATGAKVCRWAERHVHVKGPLSGQRFKLEGWQCLWYFGVYAFLRKDNGLRLTRRAQLWCGRGNGKSTKAVPMCTWHLSQDGDGGAQVVTAATSEDQAAIVFGDCKAVLRHEKMAGLRTKLGLEVGERAITQPRSNSSIRALSATAGTKDGLASSLVLEDEVHAMLRRELHDVLETSLGKRPQSLLCVVSTAGFDNSGVGKELQDYARLVVEGKVEDFSTFALIFEADIEDKYDDERAWEKANPNLDVSVDREYLRQLCAKAKVQPSARATFEIKHLNRWRGSAMPWVSDEVWAKACRPGLTREDYLGKSCFIGVDLASVSDLASVAYVFPSRRDDGKLEFACFVDSYLSRTAVNDARNASYAGWAELGHLVVTEGDCTDYHQIEADILEACGKFQVEEFAYDPWQAQGISQRIGEERVQTVEVRQGAASMTEPMRRFEEACLTGELVHDGNPVNAWALSNVRVQHGRKSGTSIGKERPEQKIDPISALLTAYSRAMFSTGESVYESRGLFSFN